MHNEVTQAMSPDHILVDRLLQMRDGFAQADPAQMLAQQVALGEMTGRHAEKLLGMVADADAAAANALGECDWCCVEVNVWEHQCPFLADLPDYASR